MCAAMTQSNPDQERNELNELDIISGAIVAFKTRTVVQRGHELGRSP
jgi:ATP sulfurylase